MTLTARKHPDYPFRDENLEATIHVVDTFVADPPLTSIERGEVLEFVRMTHQYAFLEKLIQGDVRFDLPAHMELLTRTVPVDRGAGGRDSGGRAGPAGTRDGAGGGIGGGPG